MREDNSRLVAKYIVNNDVNRSKRGADRVLNWAKKVMRDIDRAMRHITRLYDFCLNDKDTIRRIRRNQKGKKKKKFTTKPVYKYGIQVPRNAEHAITLDKENDNTN